MELALELWKVEAIVQVLHLHEGQWWVVWCTQSAEGCVGQRMMEWCIEGVAVCHTGSSSWGKPTGTGVVHARHASAVGC